MRSLVALTFALTLAAPSTALALSRTVHVRPMVINVNKHEIFVHITGGYVRHFKPGPPYDQPFFPDTPRPHPEPPVRGLVDLNALGFDGPVSIPAVSLDSLVGRILPGHTRGIETKDRITSGHTRHYTMTFYERRGDQVVAFASHHFKAKMNLKGINECQSVSTVDPEGRLVLAHKKSDGGLGWADISAKIRAAYESRVPLFGSTLSSENMDEFLLALGMFAGGQALSRVAPGLGEVVPAGVAVTEALIKSSASYCHVQAWVMPPLPPRHLAQGKPARQSSLYGGGRADLAVDGSNDANYGGRSVTHTLADKGAWWEVDLGQPQEVGRVVVRNRTDCCGDRLANFELRVSEDGQSWQSYPHPGVAGATATFQVRRRARFVRVALLGTNYLSLAEVEVFAPGQDLVFFSNPAHNLRLGARADGTVYGHANRLEWESWRVEDAGNSEVFLVSFHGQNLGATPDGRVYTNHNRQQWERWRIVDGPNGTKLLRSAHGHHLGVRPDGSVYTHANTLEWERWVRESP